jgi:hypothetical protein
MRRLSHGCASTGIRSTELPVRARGTAFRIDATRRTGRPTTADERRARQCVSAPSVLAALLAASVTAHDTYPEPDQRPEERRG